MALDAINSLKKELELNFDEIIQIMKGLSNEKRFQILILLLGEARSFKYLLDQTELQKTALANHLNLLLKLQLIKKSEYGHYQIGQDSRNILQTICNMWQKVIASREEQFRNTQSKGLSQEFLGLFFKHT